MQRHKLERKNCKSVLESLVLMGTMEIKGHSGIGGHGESITLVVLLFKKWFRNKKQYTMITSFSINSFEKTTVRISM